MVRNKFGRLLLVLLCFSLTYTITTLLEQGKPKCFYLELDSEKMLELTFSIVSRHPEQCYIQLTVDERKEYSDDGLTIEHLARGFQCQQDTRKQFFQKFVTHEEVGVSSFKICTQQVQGYTPNQIQLRLVERINPRFLEQDDADVSLLSSEQIRTLNDIMHNVTQRLLTLEQQHQHFQQSQSLLMNNNLQLKQHLSLITKIQSVIMVVAGLTWMYIMRKLRN